MYRSIGVALVLVLAPVVLSAAAEQPLPAEVTLLPLAEAIKRVQAVSPALHAAQARVAAAAGTLYQASRLPNPSLDLHEENFNPGRATRDPLDKTLDIFAVLSQPIEVGGKRAARTAAATADVEAARAGVRQIERELARETARLYFGALRSHVLARVLTNNRTGLQTLMDAPARHMPDAGAEDVELMKFRAEAVRLDTELARVRLDFTRDATALGALLGTGPVAGVRLVEPEFVDLPPGDPAELARQAVERRPEVAAAQARLERARYAFELEKARRFPDPALSAGYERTGGQDTLYTGVNVPLPFFDLNTGNIERAAAEERAAALDLEALTRQYTAETVVLLVTAQDLIGRARQVEQQLLYPAEVVRNAARTTFHKGVSDHKGGSDILQLIDAERVYAEAWREALGLKLEAHTKALEAHLAVDGEEKP